MYQITDNSAFLALKMTATLLSTRSLSENSQLEPSLLAGNMVVPGKDTQRQTQTTSPNTTLLCPACKICTQHGMRFLKQIVVKYLLSLWTNCCTSSTEATIVMKPADSPCYSDCDRRHTQYTIWWPPSSSSTRVGCYHHFAGYSLHTPLTHTLTSLSTLAVYEAIC